MSTRVNRQAEQLEALLEGRLPADEVDQELRDLAHLAGQVHQERPGPSATLTDDARSSMRARLLADIAETEAPATERVAAAARPRWRKAVSSARAALATGLASLMVGTTGVAVAAQEALPGDALYGVKKGTESVRMTLAGDSIQAGRLELRFAEERLEEVALGADRTPDALLAAGLQEMDARSLSGAQRLVELAERRGEDELLAEVDQFVERQAEGIVEVFARLPIDVRPHAEDSLRVLREIRADLLAPVAAACDCDAVSPSALCDCGAEHVGRLGTDPLPRPAREEDSAIDPSSLDVEAPSREGDPGTAERSQDPAPGGSDSRTVDSRDLVPRLPGRLDDVGRTVNDTVDSTTDTLRDTVEDTTGTVEDTVDSTTDTLEDTVDSTTDTVEDTLGSTTDSLGDAVEDTTDSVGGLLD